jgi:hypothetical protein
MEDIFDDDLSKNIFNDTKLIQEFCESDIDTIISLYDPVDEDENDDDESDIPGKKIQPVKSYGNLTASDDSSNSSNFTSPNGSSVTGDDTSQSTESLYRNSRVEAFFSPNLNRKRSFGSLGSESLDGISGSRLDTLLQVPAAIAMCINSGDEIGLMGIIEEAFLPDCVVKTPALSKELVGRQHLKEYFFSINRAVPDFVCIVSESTLNFRVISASFKNFGTRVASDKSDYLYDYVKHGRDHNNLFVEARDKSNALIKEGSVVRFCSRSFMHLILNKDMTHVEKYVAVRKALNILDPNKSNSRKLI